MRIGSLSITSLIDAEMRAPLAYYYPTEDVSADDKRGRGYDAATGETIITIGSYLIEAADRMILVDTGIGANPKTPPVAGGTLRSSLLSHGVTPDDITDVVYTHLHFDHIGWSTLNGRPFFRNAVHHCDRRDWDHFMANDYDTSWEQPVTFVASDAARVRLAPIADRMEFWVGDSQLFPFLTAIDASGHTPGSAAFLLSSNGDRGLLLGDTAHTQPELVHAWRFRRHVDSDAAVRRVKQLRDFIAAEAIPCSGSHFPGLGWGHLVREGDSFVFVDLV